MAIQVAAPSSSLGFTSSKTKYRYDVFLSFRGEDTRLTFTVRLHDALCRKGINAFIDDKKLAKGEEISPTLLKAIEKSRISIIVFSTNYATSTWCLEELARIVWCRKQKNQVVMPIFYKVDPLDVQKQRNSFGEAMADHKAGRFKNEQEKVQKWRAALHEAASLSPAWLFEDGCESGFIERIVEHAYSMIPPKRFQNIDHMVGLETRIEEVMSLMDKSDDRVCMLGIYGTGGIGKTTLAKALYKLIFYQFDGACFLFDVREESNKYQSIIRLQQTLLSEILGEQKMQLNSVDEGISYIKHRLSSKKVLLVLDDVDEFKQLEQLAGGRDWFGCGSKIIITTRNKELLIARNVEKTYEVKELSRLCSLELFCWHAFRMSQPPNGYENMSNHVIRYVHGLPLALKLVGSNLAHKDFEEWRSTLEQYKRIPERTIHEVLKISYDCLPDGAKRVFLDIACFFKKKALEFIEDILEACDDGARFYIEVLVDKSLITIDENSSRLYMHDLIQQMGKEIVRQEGPSNLGQRSRLWYYRDVLEVLQENSGSSNIEGIILDPPHQEKVEWGGIAFEKMNNLKILIIRNAQFSTSSKYFPNTLRLLDWKGYPSMTLPPNFSPSKLICLKLNGSQFTLEEPFKKSEFMTHVTYLDFSKCQFITEVPDMSQLQNLKTMIVNKCLNLTKVHDSVGSLSKLERLDVSECPILTSFPHEINMASLQELNLEFCKSLDYFPHIVGKMEHLFIVSAVMTAIKELPPSIGNLPPLCSLDLSSCTSLRELPNSLLTLPNLEDLGLEGIHSLGRESLKTMMQQSQSIICCENIETLNLRNFGLLDEDLHLTLKCFQNVEDLDLSGNDFVSLPECIKECAYLERLSLTNCKRLRDIVELPSSLQHIAAENCMSLTMESIGRLWRKRALPWKSLCRQQHFLIG
ncbi:disease resistance protein RUN1-like isoform X3 [Prosopis cineraria]|uniref:disease resistance protein RUN1-like isoform X3 n=1 Tax=Prosopis cineraria TaxID=364024 RepID=UPI002410AE13|nr:disease resistance protein RUN1-like isoform X3 [Prosopis cineraria]XP_054791333.1 disease resistance protein RUN1-like isoform X3 [Prosopis cineraria]